MDLPEEERFVGRRPEQQTSLLQREPLMDEQALLALPLQQLRGVL